MGGAAVRMRYQQPQRVQHVRDLHSHPMPRVPPTSMHRVRQEQHHLRRLSLCVIGHCISCLPASAVRPSTRLII